MLGLSIRLLRRGHAADVNNIHGFDRDGRNDRINRARALLLQGHVADIVEDECKLSSPQDRPCHEHDIIRRGMVTVTVEERA
jgi:hypothetical protein